MNQEWKATHEITICEGSKRTVERVFLCAGDDSENPEDGPAYTEAEWNHGNCAHIVRENGTWWIQGAGNCSWSVRELEGESDDEEEAEEEADEEEADDDHLCECACVCRELACVIEGGLWLCETCRDHVVAPAGHPREGEVACIREARSQHDVPESFDGILGVILTPAWHACPWCKEDLQSDARDPDVKRCACMTWTKRPDGWRLASDRCRCGKVSPEFSMQTGDGECVCDECLATEDQP